jgi:hypothetical protein
MREETTDPDTAEVLAGSAYVGRHPELAAGFIDPGVEGAPPPEPETGNCASGPPPADQAPTQAQIPGPRRSSIHGPASPQIDGFELVALAAKVGAEIQAAAKYGIADARGANREVRFEVVVRGEDDPVVAAATSGERALVVRYLRALAALIPGERAALRAAARRIEDGTHLMATEELERIGRFGV